MLRLIPPTDCALFKFASQRLWDRPSLLNFSPHLIFSPSTVWCLCIQVVTYGDQRILNMTKAFVSTSWGWPSPSFRSFVEKVAYLCKMWFRLQVWRRGRRTWLCTFSPLPRVLSRPLQNMVWMEELKDDSFWLSFILLCSVEANFWTGVSI